MAFKAKRITYLKVKIKSLAIEAQIIRKEENKCIAFCDEETYYGLIDHRKKHIRPISREANIAYGFLRGMPYHKIEVNPKTEPNWEAIDKNCMNFGDRAKIIERIPDSNTGYTKVKWKSAYTEELMAWKDALVA